MKSKKVLILSLGTGSYALDDEKRALQNDDEYVFKQKHSAYRKANYEINGNTYSDIPYVAEPLIVETQPDEIVVLGTVKSTWSGLYLAFAEDTNHMKQDFKRLREFDTGKTVVKDGETQKESLFGLGTSGEDLNLIEKEIDDIFAESNLFQKMCGKIKTRVFLLRYGIDQNQLEENYHRLGRIRELFMDKDTEYEVSFDITHAFRSMSIYNLIILNYLKNITGADIHIRNVFYGNLEVSGENNKIATIVDLEDIVDVLDLTNGVSEFRNTGNAKTLLDNLPKEEKDDYADALRMFDHATQINDFNMIQEALRKLEEAYSEESCNKGLDNKERTDDAVNQGISQHGLPLKTDVEKRDFGTRTRYEDYREMVQRVIATELYGNETWKYDDFSSLSMGEQRLRLGKWYMRQNRYGVAIATGLEALRSFLVVPYLEGKNKGQRIDQKGTYSTNSYISPEEKEDNRRDAESALDRAAEVIREEEQITNLSKSDQIPQDILILAEKMSNTAKEIKPIRNTFAHNLKEDSRNIAKASNEKKEESDGDDLQQIESTKEIEKAFKKCSDFFEVLESFRDALLANPETAVKLLQIKPKEKSGGRDLSKENKKAKQAFIIWHNYNSRNTEMDKQIRNTILDGLCIRDKEERKTFRIMQYPPELALKCKNGIDEQLQYAYEVFSSGKEDSETAIIYCDDRNINSFQDYTSLVGLIPKLIACGFLDVHYLNVNRKPPVKSKHLKTERVNLKHFFELRKDFYKERLLSGFERKSMTNSEWKQTIQDTNPDLI